jgi:hypothetical protein
LKTKKDISRHKIDSKTTKNALNRHEKKKKQEKFGAGIWAEGIAAPLGPIYRPA